MKAEELKRYDAYPILVHALREALDALEAYGGPQTMVTRGPADTRRAEG